MTLTYFAQGQGHKVICVFLLLWLWCLLFHIFISHISEDTCQKGTKNGYMALTYFTKGHGQQFIFMLRLHVYTFRFRFLSYLVPQICTKMLQSGSFTLTIIMFVPLASRVICFSFRLSISSGSGDMCQNR